MAAGPLVYKRERKCARGRALPVNEGPFRVEQIKLVVEPGPGLHDGRRVADHADGPLHGRQVPSRHDGGRLVIDPHLMRSNGRC